MLRVHIAFEDTFPCSSVVRVFFQVKALSLFEFFFPFLLLERGQGWVFLFFFGFPSFLVCESSSLCYSWSPAHRRACESHCFPKWDSEHKGGFQVHVKRVTKPSSGADLRLEKKERQPKPPEPFFFPHPFSFGFDQPRKDQTLLCKVVLRNGFQDV